MKVIKFGLIMCLFLIWLPDTASARCYFRMSFGAPGIYYHGYPYTFYRPHYRPYYRWHRGYYNYRWRYRSPCIVSRRYYLPRYYVSPLRVNLWISDWIDDWVDDRCPVIIDSPMVMQVPRVITKKEVVVKPRYDEQTAKLFGQLRQKKSELVKKLRIGDKEERKKAISDLAGFSFDTHVRRALENILLSDADPEMRKEVAKSFSKVKNKWAIPALERAKEKDSDPEVRKEAEEAIKKINPVK